MFLFGCSNNCKLIGKKDEKRPQLKAFELCFSWFQDIQCLSSAATCSSAQARVSCLMSKDPTGPCVWCGGAACNDQTGAVCESFGSWKAGGSMAVIRRAGGQI